MSDVTIEITDNGPYKVSGPIELLAPDGSPVEVAEGRNVFLCRCGGSSNKPFCDGTHSRVGFQGAMAAAAEADAEAEAQP
ncbi:MAG TPA: CDGSH iron-sulfur domain-containing protein [Solirubrobacteraceae bacterium]|jgi:3-phenylpropionate/trans-cinnamate dioxygenase ferredoxin subunit